MRKTANRLIGKAIMAAYCGHLRNCRLVLHIGFHKTGTTFLQQQIATARQDLFQEGFLFPTTGMGLNAFAGPRAGRMAGHETIGQLFVSGNWTWAGLIVALLSHEGRSQRVNTIFVSVENLSYVRHPEANAIGLHFLNLFQNVDIVVYLRRWDHWIESLYKERLLGGETRDFPTFLSDEQWLLDFPSRLDSWSSLCSKANTLRVFDYSQEVRGNGLLKNFFNAVLPDIRCPMERTSVRANKSVNAAQANALRLFNLDRREGEVRRERLDTLLASSDFQTLEGSKGFFSDGERGQFLSGFESQNAILQQEYGIDLLS